MDPDVPLVVPEVNPHAIAQYTQEGDHRQPEQLHHPDGGGPQAASRLAGIRRIVVSTYQAVSGTGRKAINELRKQVGELLNGRPITCSVYPHQIAFNCLPQIDSFEPDGSTREEMKMVNETRKIMEADIRVTATAVRVPVFYGHSESINIETVSQTDRGQGSRTPGGCPRCRTG